MAKTVPLEVSVKGLPDLMAEVERVGRFVVAVREENERLRGALYAIAYWTALTEPGGEKLPDAVTKLAREALVGRHG